jgi:uncharacterized RDD family membrane protein YckC
LQEYRKRQKRLREGPEQPELVFSPEERAEGDIQVQTRAAYAAAAVATPLPPQRRADRAPTRTRFERVEIDLLQPSLDFSGAASAHTGRGAAGWHTVLVSPMASMRERRMAAYLDLALLVFAYGAFLALFGALGGRLAASRMDAAVLAAAFALFYAQYFALFTVFGGATPGMMWRKLRLVRFDGRDPHFGDAIWRSFGYLVSAATLMLGFLWALWDEDHLCWHDRISHTHLTWTGGPHADLNNVGPGYENDDGR